MNDLIINTLSSLNIPVKLLNYTGKATTYIVFQEYLNQGETFSEDEEDSTGHYIQLSLYNLEDNPTLIKQIKDLLKSVEFKRQTERDLYETESGYHNHVFRFFYLEQIIW